MRTIPCSNHGRSLTLVISITLAGTAAACGGAIAPVTEEAGGHATAETPASDSVDAVASIPSVGATSIEADLAAIGMDIEDLPDWDTMIAGFQESSREGGREALVAAVKPVMKLFGKSLGVECKECHSLPESAVPEERTRVVRGMWNDFVRALKMKDGGHLFCDSCHQGKTKFLVRDDTKALSRWMRANLVEKLARVDGQEHTCTTCHGQPFNGTFLATWAKGE